MNRAKFGNGSLLAEYQFDQACHLLADVPPALESCGTTVAAAIWKHAHSLRDNRANTERSLDKLQETLEIARSCKRYVRAAIVARQRVRRLRDVGSRLPRLFSSTELKQRLEPSERDFRKAFWRAVLAVVSGEVLFRWLLDKWIR